MAHPTRSLRPPPCSQGDEQTEKSWTISAAHFGDDGSNLLSATSNRSAPYAWDRITGGDDVRVSIGGHALPFTSTSEKPVFASDISGAEWTVTPEVRAGAVVLVLTAEDQTESAGFVESVTVWPRPLPFRPRRPAAPPRPPRQHWQRAATIDTRTGIGEQEYRQLKNQPNGAAEAGGDGT